MQLSKPYNLLSNIGLYLLLIMAMLCAGVSLALGGKIILIVLALFGAVLVLALSLKTQFVLLLVITFAIQGTLGYFGNSTQPAWLPALLCICLLINLVLGMAVSSDFRQKVSNSLFLAINIPITIYLLVLIFSTMLNQTAIAIVVAGLKNALPFWVVVPILAAKLNPKLNKTIWKILIWIFWLQIPFVTYQHFIIAPSRKGESSWDAVVGTFGGGMNAGGHNATLVVYSIWIMCYFLANYTLGLVNRKNVIVIILGTIFIILMGEVKAAILWLPLAVFIALRRHVFRNITALLSTTGIMLVFIISMWGLYKIMYWDSQASTAHANTEQQIKAFSYFFDPANVDSVTGEVGRGAALALWWNDMYSDGISRFIGYGAGSSRISQTSGLGEVASRYFPLDVAGTAVSMLLWDGGVFGFLAFFIGVLIMITTLYKISHDQRYSSEDLALMDCFLSLSVIILFLIPYNRYLLDEPCMQLMLSITFGYVSYWKVLNHPKHLKSNCAINKNKTKYMTNTFIFKES